LHFQGDSRPFELIIKFFIMIYLRVSVNFSTFALKIGCKVTEKNLINQTLCKK